MATKPESESDIYQIKVTLLGTKPSIWRRLRVLADLPLAQLHNVLQIAMGWEDDHMHEFRVGQRRFGQPEPHDPFMRLPRTESERTARLSTVLGRTGAKMVYVYDFGDSWEPSIVLEKQLPAEPGTAYPVCTDGKLAWPPEDCGGIPGFYDLLDALDDPNHERHDELTKRLDRRRLRSSGFLRRRSQPEARAQTPPLQHCQNVTRPCLRNAAEKTLRLLLCNPVAPNPSSYPTIRFSSRRYATLSVCT